MTPAPWAKSRPPKACCKPRFSQNQGPPLAGFFDAAAKGSHHERARAVFESLPANCPGPAATACPRCSPSSPHISICSKAMNKAQIAGTDGLICAPQLSEFVSARHIKLACLNGIALDFQWQKQQKLLAQRIFEAIKNRVTIPAPGCSPVRQVQRLGGVWCMAGGLGAGFLQKAGRRRARASPRGRLAGGAAALKNAFALIAANVLCTSTIGYFSIKKPAGFAGGGLGRGAGYQAFI